MISANLKKFIEENKEAIDNSDWKFLSDKLNVTNYALKTEFFKMLLEVGINPLDNMYSIPPFFYTGILSLSMDKIYIPEHITIIEERAFMYNLNIKEVHLPSTLKSIGNYAFYKCESLNDFYYDGNVGELLRMLNIAKNVFRDEHILDKKYVQVHSKGEIFPIFI